MPTNTNKRLVVGGPNNGELSHWLGDVVELPGGDTYEKHLLQIEDKGLPIYLHSSLTKEQALKMIQEGYLSV